MPSTSTDRSLKTALAVGSFLILAYSLVIVQQILLGVLAVVAVWGIYLVWRLIKVLERIAGSLEVRVAQSEESPERSTARADDPERELEREL